MMNTRLGARSAPVLLLASLTLACSEAAPTAPELADRPSRSLITREHGQVSEALPFRLEGTAVFLGQEFAPDFGPPSFGKSDFQGRCSTPSDFVIRFKLSGEGTYVGSVAGEVEHCTQVDFQTGALSVTDGAFALTASSGDELFATYVGASGPSGLEEHVTFAGGSGRFADAAGDGILRPVCDQSAGTCTYSLSGALTYEASDVAER